MKNLLILFLVFVLGSCFDQKKKITNNQEVNEEINSTLGLTNEISKELAACIPENWTVWEEYSEENKTYLAHVGKGIYDLHFRANYELVDTLMGENYNRKDGHNYHPEIILHFYKNEESIKESVKFTQENPKIVSDIKFAQNFGETTEFLVYECSIEKQRFQPVDERIIELRKCLIDKITTYNNGYGS